MAGLMPPENISIISISKFPHAGVMATYCLANRFLHSTQAKGFSDEWARLCRLRCSERVNTLSQMSHFISCILGSSVPPVYCDGAWTPPVTESRSDMVGGHKIEAVGGKFSDPEQSNIYLGTLHSRHWDSNS